MLCQYSAMMVKIVKSKYKHNSYYGLTNIGVCEVAQTTKGEEGQNINKANSDLRDDFSEDTWPSIINNNGFNAPEKINR